MQTERKKNGQSDKEAGGQAEGTDAQEQAQRHRQLCAGTATKAQAQKETQRHKHRDTGTETQAQPKTQDNRHRQKSIDTGTETIPDQTQEEPASGLPCPLATQFQILCHSQMQRKLKFTA